MALPGMVPGRDKPGGHYAGCWATEPGRGIRGPAARGRRRRRIRRAVGRRRARALRRASHAGGPQRLQHVPAAALPGSDRGPDAIGYRLPAARGHPQEGRQVPPGRPGWHRPGGSPGHADRGRQPALRLPDPRHRRRRLVLRHHRGGAALLQPVHPPRRHRAARPADQRARAAQHPRSGREAGHHDRRRRAYRRRAGRHAGRPAEHRARRRLPGRGPRRPADPPDRAGTVADHAVHPGAARLCLPAAARPGRRGAAGHRHRRGVRAQRPPCRRHGAAQRHHGLGGGRQRTGASGRAGPGARPGRPRRH